MPLTSIPALPAGAILARVIRPEDRDLTPAVAEALWHTLILTPDSTNLHQPGI